MPVSAIIVDPKSKKIIARAHNLSIRNKDPLAHAEILVIRKALKFLDKKRLDGMDIYCSLEPCVMCTSAIALSQIREYLFLC